MSAEDFGGLDLVIEPVRGVRSFDVDSLGRLTGVVHRDVWRPGENVATCHAESVATVSLRTQTDIERYMAAVLGGSGYSSITPRRGWLTGRIPDDPAPIKVELEPESEPEPPKHSMANCKCGFYAYFEGSNDYRTDARASAVVEGYGETVVGARGFRSQKARIVAICLKPGEYQEVQSHYYLFAGGIPATKTVRLTAQTIARVKHNYRDVPIYEDFEAMVADFPPDAAAGPTPETDPDFWTRVAP